MMIFPFEKWHGCKNDFIIFWLSNWDDLIVDSIKRSVPRIASKDGSGIGSDGVFLLFADKASQIVPSKILLWNPDGSKMNTCGNGIRCIAGSIIRRAHKSGLLNQLGDHVLLPLESGDVLCRFLSDPVLVESSIYPVASLEMGAYSVEEVDSNIVSMIETAIEEKVEIKIVTMANKHICIFLDNKWPDKYIDLVGPLLQKQWNAEGGINVHIVKILEVEAKEASIFKKTFSKPLEYSFEVSVWERGAGKTAACGSGACAVNAAAIELGYAEENAWSHIRMPGGSLFCLSEKRHSTLAGPMEFVFDGAVDL